jgi:hypothetical protein
LIDRITKTVTATAAVHTRVKKHCIDFDIEFAGNCCPKRHLKKKKKKPCNKKTKKDQHKGKGKGKGKGKRDEADDDEEEEDDEEDTLQERGLSAPIQTTAPCTIGPFTSFTTTMQLQVPIVTAYDFGSSGATLYVQDVIGVNVCGDIYIDGVYSKSTNCPAKDGTATNLGDDQPDPAKAKASGNYAYAYVSIPPGLHSVTFLETYDGGAAGYQIYSKEQCPAIEYLDQYTTTEYFTATDTETTTLPATATHTNFVSKVVTSLHAAVTHTLTVTPAAVTKTVTSSATHTTTVHKCHKLKERISCPKHRSRHMLDHWMLGQLKLYKGKTTKKHVGVTCAEYTGEFIY